MQINALDNTYYINTSQISHISTDCYCDFMTINMSDGTSILAKYHQNTWGKLLEAVEQGEEE